MFKRANEFDNFVSFLTEAIKRSRVQISSGPLIFPKMTFEISKHQLVPKHSKVSDAERKSVLEHYHTPATAFPKIFKSDPAIARLDVKEGDLVRIERQSKTAGTTMYYRVVVLG